MTSKELQKAREYESTHMRYADAERPAFHLTGPIGWINDPNGFSLYKGEYHLFFQYHPYFVRWGPMHWGHAKTNDFIRWEYLPVALAPDTEADNAGCFSGSAIEMPDGSHLLMYTGVYKIVNEDGFRQDVQHQCIAIGDGTNYEKYEGNPVLTAKDLPEGGNIYDFRDPRIWKDGDTYYAAVGNRPADGSGSVLIYESKDALHWSYKTLLDQSYDEYGKMWECPDFFRLDGKDVLLVSPQEMVPVDLEFHAGYGTVALIGSLGKEEFKFTRENLHAIDYGIDFYAPQTVETTDGRRIMIAWMENWTNVQSFRLEEKLFGAMTLPREIHVVNGRLIQNPVRELENYYGECHSYENVLVCKEKELPGISGRRYDMTVYVKPVEEGEYKWFKIRLCKDEKHEVTITYRANDDVIKVDRTRCGGRYDIIHSRKFKIFPRGGEIKLRIIQDNNLLEVFVNDGEQAASFKLYNYVVKPEGISFEAETPVLVDIVKHDFIQVRE